jgi:hypothetical protein
LAWAGETTVENARPAKGNPTLSFIVSFVVIEPEQSQQTRPLRPESRCGVKQDNEIAQGRSVLCRQEIDPF